MNPLLIETLAQLATTGIGLWQQMHAATDDSNVPKIATLLPLVANVTAAAQQVGDVLQKAQAEGWTDNDARWQPVFDAADKALAAAEGRLPAPGS